MSRVRLVPMIFILIISLAVLLVGWQAYLHFNLVKPLRSSLQDIKGVQSVQIETGNRSEVDITLGPSVKDLQQTYQSIVQTVTGTLGTGEQIVLRDNRDDALFDLYEVDLVPLLMQGVTQGNYPQIIAALQQKAAKAGVQARVTMDEQNFYVQLSKGNHYLYKVQPFALHQGGGAS